MNENAAKPISALATDEKYPGSLGAGPCLIILLRLKTNKNRCFLGSIHLSADNMISIGSSFERIKSLWESIEGKFDKENGEKAGSNEGFAIGGSQDEDTDLREYSRVIAACVLAKRFGFNLTGVKVPASGPNQSVNAFIGQDFVKYEHTEHNFKDKKSDDDDSDNDKSDDDDM